MKTPRTTKKFWVVFCTILVIGIVFMYYFIIYIPSRENSLIEKNYRILARIGENVLSKKKSYDLTAESSAIDLARSLFLLPVIIRPSIFDSLTREETILMADNSKINKEAPKHLHLLTKFSRIQAIKMEKKNKLMAVKDSIEVLYKNPFEEIQYIFDASKSQLPIKEVLNGSTPIRNANKINFSIKITKQIFREMGKLDTKDLGIAYFNMYKHFGYEYQAVFSDFLNLLDSIKFSISMEKFMAPIIKNDFDDFFLITTKEETSGRSKIKIEHQTFKNELRINNLDSLILIKDGIRSGNLIDLTINNKLYKLFYHRITFNAQKEEDWILCGLIENKSFKAQTRHVEPIIILYASLILLFVLLGMPLLKLLVMSSIERLRITNVWFSGFSLIVGSALLFLIIIATHHYWGYHYQQLDVRLKKLSNAIHINVINELIEIHGQLMSLPDIENTKQVLRIERDVRVKKIIPENYNFFRYTHFNEIIWIDSVGDQKLSLATHSINPWDIPVNLSERKYFSNANEKKLWSLQDSLPDEKVNTRQFALQSIHSYRDASHEVGFSIRLDKDKPAMVLAMATRLQSVMDPLLPPGYSFSIFDDRGEVWFSSQIDKNLQENFIDESESEILKTAMYGRISRFLTINYSGHRDRAFIRPIDNIPLFLVVHYNLNYYKSAIILAANHAALLLTFMFAISGLQLLLLFICTYRTTKLKTKIFFLNWLRPRKDPAFSVKYTRIILVLAVLLILSLLFFLFSGLVEITFCLIILPTYILLFVFIVHEILPNGIKRSDHRAIQKTIFSNSFVRSTVVIILVINFLSFRYFSYSAISLAIQFFYLVCLYIGIFLPKIKDIPSRWIYDGYHTQYKVFLFLWLIIVSIVPVFFFYKVAYHVEATNWTKFIQLEASRAYSAYRNKHDFSDGAKQLFAKSEVYGYYLNTTGEILTKDVFVSREDEANNDYHNLMMAFKPPFDTLIQLSQTPVYGRAFDNQWYWHYGFMKSDDAVMLFNKNNGTYYASIIKPFLFYSGTYSILFWFFIFILIYILYRILTFFLFNIYGIGLLPQLECISLTKEFFRLEDWKSKNIFLIGPPYSGKSTLLKQYCDTLDLKEIKFEVYNLHKHLCGRLPQRQYCKVVIIEHFEFGINDHYNNIYKLKLLEQFLTEPDTQVIVSSTVQPTWLYDYYERRIKESNAEKDEKEFEFRKNLRLWKNALASYMIVYQPLTKSPNTFKISTDDRICNELARGNFLPGLCHYVRSMPVKQPADFEDFILRVEELADSYYQSIWNSFSHAEKMQLYDLAKDQFVNLKNISIVRILIQKGIVVVEDSPCIMNRSFNDFILSVVKEDEELAMNQELRNKGTWSTIQIVLILASLGIVAFISLAQQDILHDLNALVTTLGGIVALLLRFGGLFSLSPKIKE